ncbi:zn2 cys6 dna-binding [Trichoderma arundinaceum]|uniref:Zn2 cys6 dna-binding n=1 Tax=Trichoderma arundinaceum TaxID=490622 RepID=A0A395NHQ2_TRIAR|nr:zn2 cys6 dna-binding [Trichoderma arundinaceum]
MSPSIPSFQSKNPPVIFPNPKYVEYLARHFTIKPVPAMDASNGTGISYEPEARATLSTLCATSEPAVHHALASLNALRRAFDEQCGHLFPSSKLHCHSSTPGVQYGIQEYVLAIRSLLAKISDKNYNASSIRSALLCCQIFMSIELALDDFSSATQHFIRGLRIMHECLTRPYLSKDGSVIAAQCVDMPAVDVFTIKLFLTPCPSGLTDDFLPLSDVEPRMNRVLFTERAAVVQANMRLATLGRFTLQLLKGVSQLSPTSSSPNLVKDRSTILEQLQAWKENFATIEKSRVCQINSQARLGTTFSIFFNLVLQVVATLATRPPGSEVKNMKPVFDELLAVAHKLKQLKKEVN